MRRLFTFVLISVAVGCGGSPPGRAADGSATGPSPVPTDSSAGLLQQVIPQEYRDAACDAEDPRLAAAKITLPPASYREGRTAAACVALEWLDNEGADYPETEIIAPPGTSKAAIKSLRTSASWQLRLLWERRTDREVTVPTAFIFDSKKFLCSDKHPALREEFYLYRECADASREWTCEENPGTALGAGHGLWSDTPRRAGVIQFSCSVGTRSVVIPYKFYLGLVICDDNSGAAVPLCSHWASAANYIYALYLEELGLAQQSNRTAKLDLCPTLKWPAWCPNSPRQFRGYTPSAEWLTLQNTFCWPGSDPFGDDGDCTPAEIMDVSARGYAFEWLTAHFGIDGAFGIIPATMLAGGDAALYVKILERYTGMAADQLFSNIDAYVVARLGERIR